MMMSGDKIRRNGVLYNVGVWYVVQEQEKKRVRETIMCVLRVNCKWGDDTKPKK